MPAQTIFPHLCIQGAADAVEFYKKALGATEVMRLPHEDGKRLMHARSTSAARRSSSTTSFRNTRKAIPTRSARPRASAAPPLPCISV